MKKILVLGGTGAMGVYLVPKLAAMGYDVDVVALDKGEEHKNVNYITGNAKDEKFIAGILARGYNAIVDFMIYETADFKSAYKRLLNSTDHYIFLSSYRVYANEDKFITENSPRLLDVNKNEEFLSNVHEYSLYKAEEEDILRNSDFHNYTIVRPAITYSKFRFQLVTLEADTVVYSASKGQTVYLPENALNVYGTMTWAGDVAEMISRLLFNRNALGETYTVSTSEYHTWNEIAEYYKELIGLKYVPVEQDIYLKLLSPTPNICQKYQLLYDRLFDRRVDNSKILTVTGLKQSELMPLFDGLKHELQNLPENYGWNGGNPIAARMLDYAKNRK